MTYGFCTGHPDDTNRQFEAQSALFGHHHDASLSSSCESTAGGARPCLVGHLSLQAEQLAGRSIHRHDAGRQAAELGRIFALQPLPLAVCFVDTREGAELHSVATRSSRLDGGLGRSCWHRSGRLRRGNRLGRSCRGCSSSRLRRGGLRSFGFCRFRGLRCLQRLRCLRGPETLLRRHGKFIARKYDGSRRRKPGRPSTRED